MLALHERDFALPRWLGGAAVHWTTALAAVFLFPTFCRAILLTIIPLAALDYLGSAQAVSVLFVLVSTVGVITSLMLPALIRLMGSRDVFNLGVGFALIGPVFLGLPSVGFFLVGMCCWVFYTLAFDVVCTLYIMHHVRRADLAKIEPKRILFMVIPYSIGPWLGIYLKNNVAGWVPYAVVVAMAVLSYVYFDYLGLRESRARDRVQPTRRRHRHVRQFISQKRLMLAWFIALTRSGWWATYFLYVPIYAVTMGLGETVGGALVSGGVVMAYTVTFWGRVMRRFGMRRVLMLAFAASGLASIAVTAFGDAVWLGSGLLLFAALCAACIDGAGNVPFFRAVRTMEREDMTGVFSTYRDMSQLLPPAVFAILLRFFPVHAVFAVAGLWMLSMAWCCRNLPKRL